MVTGKAVASVLTRLMAKLGASRLTLLLVCTRVKRSVSSAQSPLQTMMAWF
jgi:hypothetical protein